MDLVFRVENQNLTSDTSIKLISDSMNYIRAKFNFVSSDWDNVTTRLALFQHNDVETGESGFYFQILDKNDRCYIPYECLTAGKLLVSIVGYINTAEKYVRITTTSAVFTIEQSGYISDAEEALEPSESIYEQILTNYSEAVIKMDEIMASATNRYDAAIEVLNNTKDQMDMAVANVNNMMEATQGYSNDAKDSSDSASNSASNAMSYMQTAQMHSNEAHDYAKEAERQAEEAKKVVNSVYKFKGSVDTRADLPTDPEVGDVYDIKDEGGMDVAWTGTEWDDLGGVSISFATKDTAGIIKPDGVVTNTDPDGTLVVASASEKNQGVVRIDGSSIKVKKITDYFITHEDPDNNAIVYECSGDNLTALNNAFNTTVVGWNIIAEMYYRGTILGYYVNDDYTTVLNYSTLISVRPGNVIESIKLVIRNDEYADTVTMTFNGKDGTEDPMICVNPNYIKAHINTMGFVTEEYTSELISNQLNNSGFVTEDYVTTAIQSAITDAIGGSY